MYSKVYFDTAPLIYFLDKRDPYFSKVENFIYTLIIENTKLVTSVVTDMECLVIPYRENNKQKIRAYTDFMNYVDFERISVDLNVSQMAAEIRGKYPFIKGLDAIHLSTSILSKADIFITNDKQLLQVKEVNPVLIADLNKERC